MERSPEVASLQNQVQKLPQEVASLQNQVQKLPQEVLVQREPELPWCRRFLPLAVTITTIAVAAFTTVTLPGLRESFRESLAPQHRQLQWQERCWQETHLRGDPGQYSGNVGPLTMSNGSRFQLDRGDMPYIFVVPTLKDGCPAWFKANLLNTLDVQRTQARSSVFRPDKLHPVILVEGSSPACQVNPTLCPND